MARKTAAVALPTRENLEALVGEINTVLNLEPAIKFTKKTTDEELVTLIKAETEGNVYEIDFTADADDDTVPYFSEESKADFAALGIEILAGSPPEVDATPAPAPAKAGKAAKAAPAAKTPAAAKPAKAAKEDTGPKYTRYHAFADTVKAGKAMALDAIDDASDALYTKNGGTSNVTQAGRINDRCVQVLLALGIGTKKDKNFTYTGK